MHTRMFIGIMFCAIGTALSAAEPNAAAVPATPGTLASCPATVPFPHGIEVIKAIRVYKAANGESALETVEFKGASKAYFQPGQLFGHNLLANAGKVQIISGPPNVVLPYHAPPGKELFLTIQGSSTIMLPNGTEQAVLPGTIVIFQDGGSKTGHAGRTGPCGYVAINVFFPDSANDP